jgi:hypothetical protein
LLPPDDVLLASPKHVAVQQNMPAKETDTSIHQHTNQREKKTNSANGHPEQQISTGSTKKSGSYTPRK